MKLTKIIKEIKIGDQFVDAQGEEVMFKVHKVRGNKIDLTYGGDIGGGLVTYPDDYPGESFNMVFTPLKTESKMKKTQLLKIIKEELTRDDKAEIKKIAGKEFEAMLKNSDIKSKIERMVVDQLKKDKPTQKEVAKITEKVLVQFYKTMWTRRSFWANKLDSI